MTNKDLSTDQLVSFLNAKVHELEKAPVYLRGQIAKQIDSLKEEIESRQEVATKIKEAINWANTKFDKKINSQGWELAKESFLEGVDYAEKSQLQLLLHLQAEAKKPNL